MTEAKKINILDTLSRVTTSSDKVIREIDGLRFLAVMSVVLFHLRTHLLRTVGCETDFNGIGQVVFTLLSNGGFGVNVFFAISGFILALPFFKQHRLQGRKIDIKRYYLRRLTRLEPPYIITLIIFFAASVVVYRQSFVGLLPNFLASLFYSHFIIFGEWSVINPVTWSLETEVQFYLLAPIFFLVFKVKNRNLRLSIVIGTAILFVVSAFFNMDFYVKYHLYKSLLIYLPYFLVGVLFADLFFVYDLRNSTKKSYLWDIIGIIATFTVFSLNLNHNVLLILLSLFCLTLILTSAFKGKILNYFYTRKFIYTIGGMCYTIYLIHYALIAFVINKTSQIGFGDNFFVNLSFQALIILPLLLIVSSVFFLLFEKPFMYKDWPNRFRNFFKNIIRSN